MSENQMRTRQMGDLWVALKDGVSCIGKTEDDAIKGVEDALETKQKFALGSFRGVLREKESRVLDGSGWKDACEECEGTGKRSFYECDELVDCVDCGGTGRASS